MSRDECYSCGPCGGHCDKCSASCCINIMEEHRKFFDLLQKFNGYVQSTYSQINNHFNSINNYLKNNYNIYIYICGDIVFNFLSSISLKIGEIQTDIDKIETNISKLDTEKYNINKLNEKHADEINKMQDKFDREKEPLVNKKENETLKNKKREKDDTENDYLDKKIKKDKEIENNLNNYKNQKKSLEEENYNKRKIEIDQDPNYQCGDFVKSYTEQEQSEKNIYINQIKEINKFNIPKGFLMEYGLNINF